MHKALLGTDRLMNWFKERLREEKRLLRGVDRFKKIFSE
jgi:hypothetical protein